MSLTDKLFGKKDDPKRIPMAGHGHAAPPPSAASDPSDDQMLADIKDTIANNKIAVFMKGTPDRPMCGFSATVVDILKDLDAPFKGVNAIESPRFRQVLSGHTTWPTLPQIFIGGKLVGGCDIVRELKASGELDKMVAEALR